MQEKNLPWEGETAGWKEVDKSRGRLFGPRAGGGGVTPYPHAWRVLQRGGAGEKRRGSREAVYVKEEGSLYQGGGREEASRPEGSIRFCREGDSSESFRSQGPDGEGRRKKPRQRARVVKRARFARQRGLNRSLSAAEEGELTAEKAECYAKVHAAVVCGINLFLARIERGTDRAESAIEGMRRRRENHDLLKERTPRSGWGKKRHIGAGKAAQKRACNPRILPGGCGEKGTPHWSKGETTGILYLGRKAQLAGNSSVR